MQFRRNKLNKCLTKYDYDNDRNESESQKSTKIVSQCSRYRERIYKAIFASRFCHHSRIHTNKGDMFFSYNLHKQRTTLLEDFQIKPQNLALPSSSVHETNAP